MFQQFYVYFFNKNKQQSSSRKKINFTPKSNFRVHETVHCLSLFSIFLLTSRIAETKIACVDLDKYLKRGFN